MTGHTSHNGKRFYLVKNPQKLGGKKKARRGERCNGCELNWGGQGAPLRGGVFYPTHKTPGGKPQPAHSRGTPPCFSPKGGKKPGPGGPTGGKGMGWFGPPAPPPAGPPAPALSPSWNPFGGAGPPGPRGKPPFPRPGGASPPIWAAFPGEGKCVWESEPQIIMPQWNFKKIFLLVITL